MHPQDKVWRADYSRNWYPLHSEYGRANFAAAIYDSINFDSEPILIWESAPIFADADGASNFATVVLSCYQDCTLDLVSPIAYSEHAPTQLDYTKLAIERRE